MIQQEFYPLFTSDHLFTKWNDTIGILNDDTATTFSMNYPPYHQMDELDSIKIYDDTMGNKPLRRKRPLDMDMEFETFFANMKDTKKKYQQTPVKFDTLNTELGDMTETFEWGDGMEDIKNYEEGIENYNNNWDVQVRQHPLVKKVTLSPFTSKASLSLRDGSGYLDVRQDKVLKMEVEMNDKNTTFYQWKEHQRDVVTTNKSAYVEFVRVKYRKEESKKWSTSTEHSEFIRIRKFQTLEGGKLLVHFKLPRTQVQYCNRTIQNVLALVIRIHYIPMGKGIDEYIQEVNQGGKADYTDVELNFVCATKKRGRQFEKVSKVTTETHPMILNCKHHLQTKNLQFTFEHNLLKSSHKGK